LTDTDGYTERWTGTDRYTERWTETDGYTERWTKSDTKADRNRWIHRETGRRKNRIHVQRLAVRPPWLRVSVTLFLRRRLQTQHFDYLENGSNDFYCTAVSSVQYSPQQKVNGRRIKEPNACLRNCVQCVHCESIMT
jgi:hypothetical protein